MNYPSSIDQKARQTIGRGCGSSSISKMEARNGNDLILYFGSKEATLCIFFDASREDLLRSPSIVLDRGRTIKLIQRRHPAERANTSRNELNQFQESSVPTKDVSVLSCEFEFSFRFSPVT
ncbi:hypothetical protein JTE90_011113 [Oedothorax gibbosus]|uniref:Uncharacterized protein n=1 Tax=Oedothorax gibbosus TaxID=931172 RepID=A0AAV6UD40_9ARAC|nr:hypothetical protein JTE90_011113 [Oedothorax gibbosus]